MKPRQSSKVLPIFYTTLLLVIIYLKFCLITAEESLNGNKDMHQSHSELVVASQDFDSETSATIEKEPKKQVRRLVEVGDHKNGLRVKQNIYNYYYNRPQPGHRPAPVPSYNEQPYGYDYDDYPGYYQRPPPPPQPQPPPYPVPQQNPYLPYPYPFRPLPPPAPPTVAPAAIPSSSPPSPIKPIGYMLIDTYHTRSGSFSKPIAFFDSR